MARGSMGPGRWFRRGAGAKTAEPVGEADPALRGRLPHGIGAEWIWRPPLWSAQGGWPGISADRSPTRIDADVRIFHDCATPDLRLAPGSAAPATGARPADHPPGRSLAINVGAFDGSYLSLVVTLPKAGTRSLGSRHIVRLDLSVGGTRPQTCLARLNVEHGAGASVARGISALHPVEGGDVGRQAVEFDLAFVGLSGEPVRAAWIDIFFEQPAHNAILIGDLILSRRPRAGI